MNEKLNLMNLIFYNQLIDPFRSIQILENNYYKFFSKLIHNELSYNDKNIKNK